jgi:hypothetical protein
MAVNPMRHIFLFRTSGCFFLVLFLLCLTCSADKESLTYKPVIKFEGYFNNEWLELPGNTEMPNTYEIDNDTVDIRLYSENFDNSNISMRNGIMLRMSIYPFTRDSTCGFCLPHILIVVSDYCTGSGQATYSAYPADTVWDPLFVSSANVIEMERIENGRIDIDEISIPLHIEGKSSVATSIREGRICTTAR